MPRRASIADLLLLTVILIVAAWLRFSALSNGLPSSPQVDEPEIVDRALHMMRTGTYNPAPFFDYPTLYIYVQTVTAIAFFIAGAFGGAWSSLAQASSSDFYWGFYAWGRGVTAALGTATVLVTYAIARRIGRVAALTAAALLATQPMHVRESHYVLTDVPMTFFVTLTIWLSVRASERGNTRAFLAAGLAAGLAAATKYNGGVVILAPLLAAVLTERSTRTGKWLVAVVGGAAVAFIAGAPFTVLDLPAFLDSFARLINQYARPAAPAHVLYLKHLRINLRTPALILIAAGAALAVYRLRAGRTPERVAWAATSLFAVAWFMMIAGQAIVFGRYLLPLLPAVLVILGGAIGGIEAVPQTLRTAARVERGDHGRPRGSGPDRSNTGVSQLRRQHLEDVDDGAGSGLDRRARAGRRARRRRNQSPAASCRPLRVEQRASPDRSGIRRLSEGGGAVPGRLVRCVRALHVGTGCCDQLRGGLPSVVPPVRAGLHGRPVDRAPGSGDSHLPSPSVITDTIAAVESFRIEAVRHPWLLALAALGAIALISSVFRRHITTALLSSLVAALIMATTAALPIHALLALGYAVDAHYVDVAEPTMTAVGWLFHVGQPIYHSVDSAERYAHIYGPLAFIIHGVALGLFGPSIAVSKAVGVAASLASLALLAVAIRTGASRRATVHGVAFCALGYLLFRHYSFWTRAEPLQLACVTASLVAATRLRGISAALVAGLSAGVLLNLKLTGPFYLLPVLMHLWWRQGRRVTGVAASIAIVTAVLPFVVFPNVSWSAYVGWFRLSAGSGLQIDTLVGNAEWALFLLVPLALARARPGADRANRPEAGDSWLVFALLGGMSAVVVAASKPGAGAYHLLPFIPTIAWMATTAQVRAARPGGPTRLTALVAIAWMSVTIAVAGAQQLQWLRTMIGRSGVMDHDDVARFAASHEGVIEMGYGSDEPLTMARPLLVFRSHRYLLDQPALREHQLAGIEIPAATIAAIQTCRAAYWLVPRGEEPFAARNIYPQTGFAPLYSDTFRRAFHDAYVKVSSTAYFDVWRCRRSAAEGS